MKLKRKFICIITIFALMFSVCSNAVNATEENLAEISSEGIITIKGTTDERAGTKVMYMLIRPRYENVELNTIDTANEAIEDVYQGEVESDGKFTYNYTLDDNSKSGYYLISVKVNGEAQKRTQRVAFKNVHRLNEAVQKINNGENVADVVSMYGDDIDFDTSILYEKTTNEQKDYITTSIKATVTSENLISQFKEYTDIARKLLSNSSIQKTDLKKAIEEQHTKIGLTEEEYAKYTALSDSKKEVAVAYMLDNYGDTKTMSAFRSLYNKGVSEAQKSTPTTPSYGGIGGGGSSDTIMSPVTDEKYAIDAPVPSVYFNDINQAPWAEVAVNKLAEVGIVNGKGDKTFAPNDNITREEFVSIVVRAFELTKATEEIKFADVPADAWYYDAVKKGYNCGIITGKDDKTFGTGEFLTRQDMAIIISRAAEYSGMELYTADINKELTDMDDVADYAVLAVRKMVKAKVISGYEDGSFKPLNCTTRAQVAQVIYNVLFK